MPVPARAQRRYQEQPAPALRFEVGYAVLAGVFGSRRPRVGIPDLDADSCIVTEQLQADGCVVLLPRHGLHGVGRQLRDKQLGGLGQAAMPWALGRSTAGLEPLPVTLGGFRW